MGRTARRIGRSLAAVGVVATVWLPWVPFGPTVVESSSWGRIKAHLSK